MKQIRLFTLLAAMLLMLCPTSMFAAWTYISSGNVLSAYGEDGYTAESPLSITISAPADLQFDGNYKPATLSNTAAWEAAGLTVPTILYDGKTNAPSMLGTYTASITAGGATAEVVYTIKTVIDYQSFFHNGITQGVNYDVVSGDGAIPVALNNTEQKGVWWDPVENCAVFDGQAYLQIDNPLGNVNANTGFTLTMDVWISSENNGIGTFIRSTGAQANKNGWQRLFDLSDGNEEDCIFINAGNANNGTAHLMWCLRKGYGSGEAYKSNNTGRSYWNQWCTITLVVAPGGYTTLYVNGELLTHSLNSQTEIDKITNVLNSISGFNKCYIGTSIFEAGKTLNADGFFIGKIRGFQSAEGALLPYYDGNDYHYLLSYETNGGNPITGTFEATIPTDLPTPTHPVAGAVFQDWYMDEALTIPVTTGVTLSKNTSLYAKWNYTVKMADGTEDMARWSVYPTSAPEGTTITLDYTGSKNIESIEIGNSHTYYVNSAEDLATAQANFNANPGSRLVLNTNVSTMTITAEEGVIDLNGHTVTSNSSFLLQNNTLGKAITIKNGTIIGMDGAIGWGTCYKGTVILENIYVVNDLYTDGHAYILRNGTYKNVQNFTNNDAPGTVTVYSGVTIRNRNTVSPSGGTHAGTFIDLAELAPDISGVTEVVPNTQWTFAMPAHDADVFVTYSDFEGSGTESDPYLIPDLAAWNTLAGKVNTGMTYDDKFFRQTADISGVTAYMGLFVDNQLYNQKPFMGIYDGAGHTLNVTLNASGSFLAPFRSVYDAIIKNLVVTGSVTASVRHASGLVGALAGPCTVENCLVSTNVSGTDYMGGVIGHCRYDGFTITGTVYNGTLTPTGGNYTGGLIGWGGENATPYATITNSLFAGRYAGSGKFLPVGCFGGKNATRTVSNAYYTQAPTVSVNDNVSMVKTTTYKGERVYSVTAGTGVTITPLGTPVTSYNVSKLDLYETNGIAFNGVRYGGQGDEISMNLSGAEQYMASTGTLNGTANPYSLTLEAANSVISKVVASVTTSANVTTNYNNFSDAVSAWENNSTLTLLANVETDNTITVDDTCTLDLNGYGIKRTGSGRVIVLSGSANLTINDSRPSAEHRFTVTNAYGDAGLGVVNDALTENYLTFNGGYITGGNSANGAGIYAQSNTSVVTINGGVFIGNGANTTHGGFYWGHTNPTLIMNGGRVIYNMCSAQGAGIFFGANATFRLYGGEISHNRATGGASSHAGGICVSNDAIFYLHGAPIVTANIGGNSGSGTANQPNDVFLLCKMHIDGELTNTTPIGVTPFNVNNWWDGKSPVQISFESEYVHNSTPDQFVGQAFPSDNIVRIENALWMWSPSRDETIHTSYQVTYDSRGGNAVTGQKVLAGLNASQPENPTYAGHTFDGWYDALFTEAWDFASDVVNSDTTLYAHYTDDILITTVPTAITGLIYSGEAQELVNAGTAIGGTMKYSLDNSNWSASIPTAAAAGNHTVYYMVAGDENHADFIPSPNTVEVIISDFQGSGTEDDPYLIPSTEVWNHLAAKVNAGNNYVGKYFRQTANISVTQPIGSGTLKFAGTYDGDGKTLDVDLHGYGQALEQIAPFVRLEGNSTIKNLHITGSITTEGARPASITSYVDGNSTISNCWSEVAITSSRANTWVDCGAFVGRVTANASLTMTGCLFTGSITYSNANTYEGGGLVGWTQGGVTVTLNDCVFAPSAIHFEKENNLVFNMFVGNNKQRTLNNCYYNEIADATGITKEGECAHSVTAGTGVTMTTIETPTVTYSVSGLDFYGTDGFAFNGVRYGGNGDVISLNLSHEDQAGHTFNQYTVAGGGTLANPTTNTPTLTMADANQVINVEWKAELAWSNDDFTGYTYIDFNNWKPTLTNPHNVSVRYGCVEGNQSLQGGILCDAQTGTIGASSSVYGYIHSVAGTYHIYAVHETDQTYYYDSVVYTLHVLPSAQVSLTKNIADGGVVSMPDYTDESTLTHLYITVNGTSYAYVAQGYSVRILAEPATGYHFSKWTLDQSDLSTNAAYTYQAPATITGNLLLQYIQAVFDTNTYALNVQSADAEMGSVSGSNPEAKHFLSYEISATPILGYHFEHWNDGNTDNPRTVTLISDSNFTAYYAPNSYTITYMDWETELNVDTFLYREPITEYTTSKDGWDFMGWEPEVPQTMPAENLVVYAQWICLPAQDVDQNVYPTVVIGHRCWMAENLRTTHYADGREITNVYEYQCEDFMNVEENVSIYGRLYDWYDAVDVARPTRSTRVQGICPDGWFLPNDEDFEILYSVDLQALRSANYWMFNNGDNSSGFDLRPAGMYNNSSSRYENLHGNAYLWSATAAGEIEAHCHMADCNCYMLIDFIVQKQNAFSVRCIRE
ncbi:MAG: InlB B-repeat-containing protein [Bacteroidales bacterium]|nr:InlB B-repeat-containing protein [Bacteroidales bacterium]